MTRSNQEPELLLTRLTNGIRELADQALLATGRDIEDYQLVCAYRRPDIPGHLQFIFRNPHHEPSAAVIIPEAPVTRNQRYELIGLGFDGIVGSPAYPEN